METNVVLMLLIACLLIIFLIRETREPFIDNKDLVQGTTANYMVYKNTHKMIKIDDRKKLALVVLRFGKTSVDEQEFQVEPNSRIVYTDESALVAFKVMCTAHHIDHTTLKFVENSDVFTNSDYLATMIDVNSKQQFPITPYDILIPNASSLRLIRHFYPYIEIEDINIQQLGLFQSSNNNKKQFLIFYPALFSSLPFKEDYRNLNSLEKTSMIKFSKMGIQFYDELLVEMFSEHDDLIERSFDYNIPVRMVINDASGFKALLVLTDQNEKKSFENMKVKDRVYLKNQSNFNENGSYIIIKILDDAKYLLATGFIIDMGAEDLSVLEQTDSYTIFENKYSLESSIGQHRLDVDDIVWFHKLQKRARVHHASNDRYRFVLYHQMYQNQIDEYECYEKLDFKTKDKCEAVHGVWDRKCKHDTDCPFYNVIQNNGGCMSNGHCDMPLGVSRAGYRKYYEHTKPFCKGCSDPTKPTCCEQKTSPQYIFETI